jgi:hypothetical protein
MFRHGLVRVMGILLILVMNGLTVGNAFASSETSPLGGTILAARSDHSPIDDFDLMHDGEVVGEVRVNTANAKALVYHLDADGLTPNTKYIFGYTYMPSGDPHLLGSNDTTNSGALRMHGKLRPEDVPNLESARFWVTETLPGSDYYAVIHGLRLLQNGWFIAKLGVKYSTDGGVTWLESVLDSNLTRGENMSMSFQSLGVPEGALAKIHVVVIAGKDRTGSQVFFAQYHDYLTRYSFAEYEIKGTTGNPTLTFNGIYYTD